MRIWGRWFGKGEQPEEEEPNEKREERSPKHEEAQLRAELRQLFQEREIVEQHGCFSDRELADKERQLEEIDDSIKALKNKQFRLRTQAKLQV